MQIFSEHFESKFEAVWLVCCECVHTGGYQLTRITWSQIRICPVTAPRFHPCASSCIPSVDDFPWSNSANVCTCYNLKILQNKRGRPWLDYALSFADSYPKIGRGKQRLRERGTCGLSPGAGPSRWFRSGLQQSWDPDKDSKVAIFQRDTLRMETGMQGMSR